MFLLNIIPWWGRLIAVAALVLSCVAFGWWKGHEGMLGKLEVVEGQFNAFKEETAALGKVAEARVAKITADQKEATDAVIKEYARRLAALPKFGGLRQPSRPDGSPVPQVSCPAHSADAAAADPVPVVAQTDFDTLATLAAQTTLQFVELQSWVREQRAAWP